MAKSKSKKWIFIIGAAGVVVAAGVAFLVYTLLTAGDVQTYKFGKDSIPTINSVVGKRDVSGIESGISNGVEYKGASYKSSTVSDDIEKYVTCLREEQGFLLTQDMNLNSITGTVQLAKDSADTGKIIIIEIEYNAFGYSVKVQKGKGTLTAN